MKQGKEADKVIKSPPPNVQQQNQQQTRDMYKKQAA